MAENPLNYNQNVARLGLNTDSLPDQIQPGQLTYALNAQVSNYKNSSVSYQNEAGNIECLSFPEGYQLIGVKNITSIKKVIYFLTNPITKNSEIGYSDNDECVYNVLISDKDSVEKFNFNVNHPIHKVIVRQTNCSIQIFWTDGLNFRRYLDLDKLPWKEIKDPSNDYQPIPVIGQLDANKLLIQANFAIPKITPKEVVVGGSLQMGTYQFAIQYSNEIGEGYTSYYNVTNPISIFELKTTPNFDLKTSKAISLDVSNLDVTGLYDYYNLAVIKTVNNITSVELVGTFPITKETDSYTYTGDNAQQIRLTINDIFEKFPYYDVAQDIFEVDGVLGWSNLIKKEQINYQPIWNKVKLNWETWKVPYTKFEAYHNGVNTANIRGYMRDEVYAFEGCFILENGQETDSFHIPGRLPTEDDLTLIPFTNKDADFSDGDPCDTPDNLPRWKVYNTGSKLERYANTDDDCYIGPYEYGNFAYWESGEHYPNNPIIWGDLANKPIRHHKFPDSLITHIHDNNFLDVKTYDHFIYPIGVKIDVESLYTAIEESDLSSEEKSRIKGFKISRGNRTTNKSVIAKGLLHNVGKYKYKNENETYYPNYPYNDLSEDPYFASSKPEHHGGLQVGIQLKGFDTNESKSRFVFHSPDTHFYQPFGVDTGLLKIETIEYGESYGKFVELKQAAKYKFATKDLFAAAGAIGIMFAIDLSGDFPEVRGIDGAQAFLSTKELMERLLPYYNYATFYTSVGLYNKAYAVKNEGWKQRRIEFGKYLTDGINSIEDGHLINNTRRESSVYLHTKDNLKFPHEYSATIKNDNSRFIKSQASSLLSVEQYYDLLTSIGVITSPYTANPTRSVDYEENIKRFTSTFFTVNSIEKVNQMLVLYSIQMCYLDNLDIFTQIPSLTFSPHTYILELIKNASSLEEILSWQDYESICDVYDASVLEFPEPSDTTIVSVFDFVEDPSGTLIPSTRNICLAYFKYLAFNALYSAAGAYNSTLPSPTDSVDTLGEEVQKNISSYYGSIKRFSPSQWGRIYSYETIDTGYYQDLYDTPSTIFGGDIFINKFAYKSKLSVFNRSLVNLPNDADVNLQRSGQLGYPMFWISTEPLTEEIGLTAEDIAQVYKSVGGIKTIDVVGFGLRKIGSAVAKIPTPFTMIAGSLLNLAGSVIRLFGSAKNAFKIGSIYLKMMKGIVEGLGNKNLNLDNYTVNKLTQQGHIYNYVYGIPYFFVESEVNVDNRQAYNDLEGNFYPNVGGFIPDEWTQEANVPILYDNTYTYNQTFSKQNKEHYFSHLKETYDPTKPCNTEFPNRAIYSDKSFLEETKNNWLVYRPSAYFDFPKSNGALISLDKLQDVKVLARFENKSQIYNTLTTINITGPQDAYLGNSKLFASTPPIDVADTDLGFAGSQHKFLLKTEFGDVFVDAKRGQIILLQGTKTDNLAIKGTESFFQKNLPFVISSFIKDVSTDNHFKNIGLHGVYDTQFKRLIITKLDYEPLNTSITYENDSFYLDGKKVFLEDTSLFINRSWTMSYSFVTNSWVSYHSYTPNFYIPNITYFQSGINNKASLWNHNQSHTLYNTYYGILYPYIIEYPFNFKFQDEILQNVKDYSNVRIYESATTYYEPQEIRYFNKALLYNEEQTTGILNLIPRPKNNLAIQFQYPKYNVDSKDILVSKSDNLYLYNTFWNINNKEDKSFLLPSTDYRLTDYTLNNSILDYTQRNHKKSKIRGKNLRIRHILDNASDFRIISRFIINNTVNSYK